MRIAAAATLLAGAVAAGAAAAAEPPAGVPSLPGGPGAVAQVALSLGLVVALIFVLAWAAQRLRLVQRPAADGMRVLAELALGPRERLLLVQVGDRQALLGVGPQGIVALDTLAQPVRVEAPAAPAAAPAPAAFAERLRELLDRRGAAP